jgi:hypothetical protein
VSRSACRIPRIRLRRRGLVPHEAEAHPGIAPSPTGDEQPMVALQHGPVRGTAIQEGRQNDAVNSPPAVPGSVVIHSRDADRRHDDAGGKAEVARREDLAVWLDSDPGFMPVATLLPRPRPPASQSAS